MVARARPDQFVGFGSARGGLGRRIARGELDCKRFFRCGDVTEIPWEEFDAFYVFNSFAENAFSRSECFDRTVELSYDRRISDVMRVMRRLDAAPLETVLATYYGFGGPIPHSYELLTVEVCGTGWLRIWKKKRVESAKTFWLEDDATVCALTLQEFTAYVRAEHEEEGYGGDRST